MAARNLAYEVFVYGAGMHVVRRSCNLRGILDHARQVGVSRVHLVFNTTRKGDYKTVVHFVFYDRSHSTVKFADANVARAWILSRRSWGVCTIKHDPMINGFHTCFTW